MNKKTITVLLLLTLVILIGAPTSLAKSQYLANLNEVYGAGSCSTCHVDDTRDGARTPYGTSFENRPDHETNASAALKAIGAPPTANPTLTSTPEATAVTTVSAAGTPKSPGFGIVLSIIGLFALTLQKRNNK